MVDQDGYKLIQTYALQTKASIEASRWADATSWWGKTEEAVLRATANVDFYNILNKQSPSFVGKSKIRLLDDTNEDEKLNNLMNTKVRMALGVTSTWGTQSDAVFSKLRGDFMRPVTDVGKEYIKFYNC